MSHDPCPDCNGTGVDSKPVRFDTGTDPGSMLDAFLNRILNDVVEGER